MFSKQISDCIYLQWGNISGLSAFVLLDRFNFNKGVRGLWCLTPFQQYISYIMAVSFIGGGNWSTRRKPPTCRKSLTNFIT
jgi:hypothetical protein